MIAPALRDAATTAVAVLALIGLVVRYALVPYLRDHLLLPVQEVHEQVTENHHTHGDSPTLPDRIDDVHQEVRAMVAVLDGHLNSSDRWLAFLDGRLSLLETRQVRLEERMDQHDQQNSST